MATEVRKCSCPAQDVLCKHGNSYAGFCEGCYADGKNGKPIELTDCKCGYYSGARTPKFTASKPETALPVDSEARKDIPLARGVLDYFPAALAEVAKLSKAGNDKHNPGQDLHWARGKSGDHADCILRHLTERGTIDTDGITHSAKVAWRALALLQEELEAKGAPMSRASRLAK